MSKIDFDISNWTYKSMTMMFSRFDVINWGGNKNNDNKNSTQIYMFIDTSCLCWKF